ncbi:MAG: hypothetical protein B6U86_00575 [Candidatus Altiarchaeales archaeon ex4484_43]|nr:MAG: hypothetical protein B6U86_00575 [Candidatus Altiarchaeales archaeon ex4484_43]
MAEFGRGAKAGVVAGLIIGALAAIIGTALAMTIFYDETIGVAMQAIEESGAPMDMNDLRNMVLGFMVIGSIIGAVITALFGAIFGLIYAWLYGRLPGITPIAKGVVVGLGWWIVGTIFGIVLTMAISSIMGPMAQEQMTIATSSTMMAIDTIIDLATKILYGYLLGRFWIRFGE